MFDDNKYTDEYTILGLYGAIMGQMIIDSYKGNRRQRESSVDFFKSKDFRDVVVEAFRSFNVKFSTVFSMAGEFGKVGDILESPGGSELLYHSCSLIPLVEAGISTAALFVRKGKKKFAPVPKRGVKAIRGGFQIAVI